MNQIDYDVQDFEDDLNDALEYHPNIPKRGGTALRNELSALGLDGIDNMGSKRTKSSTNNNKKSNRPQRKLLQLNEVGSYEYGAHGQLVPEGTLAWQQQQDQGGWGVAVCSDGWKREISGRGLVLCPRTPGRVYGKTRHGHQNRARH